MRRALALVVAASVGFWLNEVSRYIYNRVLDAPIERLNP